MIKVLVDRAKVEAMYADAEREERKTAKDPHRDFFSGRRNGIGSVLALLPPAPLSPRRRTPGAEAEWAKLPENRPGRQKP